MIEAVVVVLVVIFVVSVVIGTVIQVIGSVVVVVGAVDIFFDDVFFFDSADTSCYSSSNDQCHRTKSISLTSSSSEQHLLYLLSLIPNCYLHARVA